MRTGSVMICLWLATPFLWAQTKNADPRKTLDEAAKVMEAAKANNEKESARTAAEPSSGTGLLEKLAGKGERDAGQQPSFAERQMTQAADRKLSQAISDSGALVAQQSAVPALRAPESAAPAARAAEPTAVPTGRAAEPTAVPTGRAAEPTAVPAGRAADPTAVPSGKKPAPAKGAPAAVEGEGTKIVITAEGACYFSSKDSMGIFTEDVVVDHPQFHITCDELEVYMKKSEAKPKPGEPVLDANGKPVPAAEPVTPPPAAGSGDDSSIEKAIAKGRRVVIEKLTEDGDPQIGICRHATYIGIATGTYEVGDVIMRDMPQVQRGKSLIRAKAPSTYMIIKQDGRLKTYGPSTTEIIQQPDKKAPPAAAAAPTGTAPAPKVSNTAPKTKAGS